MRAASHVSDVTEPAHVQTKDTIVPTTPSFPLFISHPGCLSSASFTMAKMRYSGEDQTMGKSYNNPGHGTFDFSGNHDYDSDAAQIWQAQQGPFASSSNTSSVSYLIS